MKVLTGSVFLVFVGVALATMPVAVEDKQGLPNLEKTDALEDLDTAMFNSMGKNDYIHRSERDMDMRSHPELQKIRDIIRYVYMTMFTHFRREYSHPHKHNKYGDLFPHSELHHSHLSVDHDPHTLPEHFNPRNTPVYSLFPNRRDKPTHSKSFNRRDKRTHSKSFDRRDKHSQSKSFDRRDKPTHSKSFDRRDKPTHSKYFDRRDKHSQSNSFDRRDNPTESKSFDRRDKPTQSDSPSQSKSFGRSDKPTHSKPFDRRGNQFPTRRNNWRLRRKRRKELERERKKSKMRRSHPTFPPYFPRPKRPYRGDQNSKPLKDDNDVNKE